MDKRIGKQYKFSRGTTKNADKTLADLFDVFYHAKTAEGRSPRTLEMYRENMGYLCEYLDTLGLDRTMTSVTPDLIRSYMSWMLHGKRKWQGHAHKAEKDQTIGLSPVTVNTKIKSLRTMFRFLHDEGHITANPCARIGKIPEPAKDIKIMSVDEMRQLLAEPNRKSYAGFRDYVAINLLLDTYGRIGETMSLRESDVDFKRGFVYFDESTVKTRRGRHVPVSLRTLRLLKELIAENADFDTDYIFLTNYGQPIRHDQFRHRLKQHARNAGIELRIYPHLFRHTAATMFLENGGDLRHLATILGHSDLRMVMRYTHLSDKSIQAQHKRYSPLDRDIVAPLQRPRRMKRE